MADLNIGATGGSGPAYAMKRVFELPKALRLPQQMILNVEPELLLQCSFGVWVVSVVYVVLKYVPAGLLVGLFTAIVGFIGVAGGTLLYVRRRGLLSFLPRSAQDYLRNRSLYDCLSGESWDWGPLKPYIIFFLGLSEEESVRVLATIPSDARRNMLRPGLVHLLPPSVQQVLQPSPALQLTIDQDLGVHAALPSTAPAPMDDEAAALRRSLAWEEADAPAAAAPSPSADAAGAATSIVPAGGAPGGAGVGGEIVEALQPYSSVDAAYTTIASNRVSTAWSLCVHGIHFGLTWYLRNSLVPSFLRPAIAEEPAGAAAEGEEGERPARTARRGALSAGVGLGIVAAPVISRYMETGSLEMQRAANRDIVRQATIAFFSAYLFGSMYDHSRRILRRHFRL